MRRERLFAVSQSAEIDNAADARFCRGRREILRRLSIRLLERTRRAHRMHQIVGRVHILQRLVERIRVKHIAGHNLCSGPGPPCQHLRSTCKTPNLNRLLFQRTQKPSPDIACSAGQQDQAIGILQKLFVVHRDVRSLLPAHLLYDAFRRRRTGLQLSS